MATKQRCEQPPEQEQQPAVVFWLPAATAYTLMLCACCMEHPAMQHFHVTRGSINLGNCIQIELSQLSTE